MSQIFEIFGFRLDDNSQEAQSHRARAWCPFMNDVCDGGGNRYATTINLDNPLFQELKQKFPSKSELVPGVCSLELVPGQMPWIVCPRRLLALGREQMGVRRYQAQLEKYLLSLLGYPPGTRLGIWREVKLQYSEAEGGTVKKFDYTFDYVLMPLKNVSIGEILEADETAPVQLSLKTITSSPLSKGIQQLQKRGFRVTSDPIAAGGYIVHDYPIGQPSIIEIMTSSTSGGDKKKRSQIAQAFEDAMLGRPHLAPGINYRQVWARMASQLLVKSEVAMGWAGVAIWVVQDVLVDYISQSTGLNMRDFISDQAGEVNMLSFSYGDPLARSATGVIDLPVVELFAGPIAPVPIEQAEKKSSFIDIVRLPVQPPIRELMRLLVNHGPAKYQVVVLS
ncbi:MAG: hypothetical protein K1X50_11410 [Candidatus Promineofilum sp.]|nr:hypothetical protein [Promineifilum sp.]